MKHLSDPVRLVALGLSLALWFGPLTHAAAPAAVGPAKHIILFVGDGMHLQHEIAASRYLTGRSQELSFHKFAVRAYCTTWNVTSYNRSALSRGVAPYDPATFDPVIGYNVLLGGNAPCPRNEKPISDAYYLGQPGGAATDSAAAATALATGHKTDSGRIAWRPGTKDHGPLETIAEQARAQKGMAIGLVSTVPFSHATPAAFVSHTISRNNYTQIADQIIFKFQPEVVIGGGNRHWGGNYLSAATQMALETNGTVYTYVGRQAGVDGGAALLAAAARVNVNTGGKLFGLFGGPGGHFEVPEVSDTPGQPSVSVHPANPTLAQATLATLQVLGQDPDGFFALIEQGDIDWSNHANNYRQMIGGVIDLDRAVQAAVDFVNRPGDGIDWDNTLIIVTSDHSNSYMRLAEGRPLAAGDLPTQVGLDGLWSYPAGEVTYATRDHTNEPVSLRAQGAGARLLLKYTGSWYPGTELVDNTQVYQVMREAAGLAAKQPGPRR